MGFEDGIDFLSSTPLILGGYITVAGAAPGEGAVVTRNSTMAEKVQRLSDGLPTEKPWFLVQTNYDGWEPDPASDNRKTSAVCLLEEIGQDDVSLDALWGVMSDKGKGKCKGKRGVYNGATIHTELSI